MKLHKVYKLRSVSSEPGAPPMRMVETEIGGVKGSFLVDTGSNICAFAPQMISKLGLLHKVRDFGHAAGIASEVTKVCGVKADLEVLGKRIDKAIVFLGVPVSERCDDGIIGIDVLNQYKRVTFDNERNELILEDK